MSDLQCPARFLLVCEPDASVAQSLRYERVAAVYDGAPGAGGAVLGRVLGLPVQALARPIALVDVLEGAEDAVNDLESLADLHRGETVVVSAVGRAGARTEISVDGDGLDRIAPGGEEDRS
ncbi:MAG TPA: hypothetical protein VLB29_15655 [Nocardioidaceae bacterium]|nr:hypothetical protein [Nocardioidaceae bacterium]